MTYYNISCHWKGCPFSWTNGKKKKKRTVFFSPLPWFSSFFRGLSNILLVLVIIQMWEKMNWYNRIPIWIWEKFQNLKSNTEIWKQVLPPYINEKLAFVIKKKNSPFVLSFDLSYNVPTMLRSVVILLVLF